MSDSNEMKVKFERIRIFRSRNSAIPRTKDFFNPIFVISCFFSTKKNFV